MKKNIIGVGCLIVNIENKFLLGHRIKGGENPSWCLPGGHLEANESFEMACKREILEETGLHDFSPPRCFALIQDLSTSTPSLTAACISHLPDIGILHENPEPHNFKEWRWFHQEHLPEALFPHSKALISAWNKGHVSKRWNVYSLGSEGKTP